MPTFPHIALPLAVVAALGIAPLAAADREPPPPPPPPPQEEYWSDKPPKENIQWERPLEACSNMGRKITCPVWLKCLDDRKKKGQGTEPPKSETEHLSLVDNRSFNYIHWANDYRLLPVDGDCVPCVDDEDQVLPGVRYPILEWIRVHRYRDTSEHSSFGPGVYSPYDLHLQIDRFGNQASDPHRVVVIDPSDLEKSVNADPDGDGRFTGVRGNRIDGIRFYDSAGDQVLTPDGAKTGVLTTFDGERQHFDIFDLASGLPAPWRHGAIGDVNQIGSVSHRDGSFELSASGSDIWNTRDEFGYVYQAVTGDVEIVARVDRIRTPVGLFEEDSDFWAKVGLMIRAGLSDDVAHASIFATPGVSAFQWRESTGSSSGSHHQGRSPGPVWLKLVRSGDQFSGATSTDGNTWTQIGSHSIPMGAVVYVGLATTSHRDGTKTDGSYSGVSLDATPVAESAWPMPASGAPATAIQLAGRLTRREDRFGYGVSVSYRDWSPVELDESPDHH